MYSFIYFFYLFLAFIVGCCIGSFVNVVIYRLPLIIFNRGGGELLTLSFPHSHCPHCKFKVYKRDNIPVISWFLLEGKCRHCKNTISKIYPLSEFIFGVIFSTVFYFSYQNNELITIVIFLIAFSTCYAIFFIDLKWYIIPDELSYLLIWLGLISSVMKWTSVIPIQAVLGCVFIWVCIKAIIIVFKRVTGKEGMGDGDAKLFAAGATFIGISQVHWLFLLSSIFGIICYVIFRLYSYSPDRGDYKSYYDIDEKHHVPFGPAICLAIIFLFYYNQMN